MTEAEKRTRESESQVLESEPKKKRSKTRNEKRNQEETDARPDETPEAEERREDERVPERTWVGEGGAEGTREWP